MEMACRLLRRLVFFFILLKTVYSEEVDACDANEPTCKATYTDRGGFILLIENKSAYRIDVYWDDGEYGIKIMTLERSGMEGSMNSVNTFKDHSFFFTRHGMKQALFDPETDVKHRYITTVPGKKYVIPETAAPSKTKCQDRFSVCEKYAKMGYCSNSPGWMIVHCCTSCDKELDASRLIDPKIRCSKENLNITEPAWKPGDLNKLFTSWVTEEKYAKYAPTVHSSPDVEYRGRPGPWVITFDDFLTDFEVEALIHGGEISGYDRSTDQGEVNELGEMEQVVSKTRTSSNAWCREQCERLPGVKSATDKIEMVTGVPRKNFESFQILEYGDNQFYRMHHDSSGRDTTPAGPRILTFFLYLSDVEEGGETYFNKLKIAVTPKKGKALVWPSVLDEDPEFWDDRMYHEAKDVIRGLKRAANHWIHLNDFEGPNHWGCTGSFS